MTTVTPNTSNTAAANASRSNAASSQLAGNFETFLTLLTAQLQNQDPLSPMDTQQFTQQLVQYSGVEQQLRTNSLLESLTAMTQASAGATAVSYLGRTVTANTALAGLEANGSASWDYELPRGARTNNLRVVDQNNRTIFSTTGKLEAGKHSFSWDGRTLTGARAAPGNYRLVVEPVGADNRAISASISQTGPITGVDMSGTTPLVRLKGADIPLSAIARIGLQQSN
jgi:flagellar basal-body rod modification protein FlgD